MKMQDFSTKCSLIVIGDLGFAKSVQGDELSTSYAGTPLYMAPEIMNGEEYTSQVDIWSLGIIIYQLLVGFAPFTGGDLSELADKVNKGDYGVPKNVELSLDCVDLLNKCLQYQPKKRISHADLIGHPFFQQSDTCKKIKPSADKDPEKNFLFVGPTDSLAVSDENSIMFNAKEGL